METYKPTEAQKLHDEFIAVIFLALGFVVFCFWFYPQYALAFDGAQTNARITSVEDTSFEYNFYDSIADKTLYFRHEIRPEQAAKLRQQKVIKVIYAKANSDILVIPSVLRPLPVWVYLVIHLFILLALIKSIKNALKMLEII